MRKGGIADQLNDTINSFVQNWLCYPKGGERGLTI
jgi:hypothetical protein